MRMSIGKPGQDNNGGRPHRAGDTIDRTSICEPVPRDRAVQLDVNSTLRDAAVHTGENSAWGIECEATRGRASASEGDDLCSGSLSGSRAQALQENQTLCCPPQNAGQKSVLRKRWACTLP